MSSTFTSLRGLPTVLAVNKQLQEEALELLYGDVTIEITMRIDFLVPDHWRCPQRLIDLTRLKKILFPIDLIPACPTRSDFYPLLMAAQRHGLDTRTQASHLRVLASMLGSNQHMKELDVRLYITWKMIETAESVGGIDTLIFPIMKLCNVRNMQISIKDLIEREADLNLAKITIATTIELAKEGSKSRRDVTVKILNKHADSGKDLPGTIARDSKWTALHQAASDGNEAEVRSSLDCGVEIETRDENGFTALHHAARSGHMEAVKILLEAGAEINCKGENGLTPLHLAAVSQLPMEEGSDLEDSDSLDGHTALHHAAENEQESVLRLLLGHQAVNINARDYEGRTPLSSAILAGHKESVTMLLSHKDIEANSSDNNGRSPLSLAAENCDEALVSLLLGREDVDVESKDNGGRTPLEWVKPQYEGLRVRRRLLEHKSVNMESIATLDAISYLGNLYRENHMLDAAEELYKRAIEGKKKVVGVEHLSTLDSLHDLAILYASNDRLTEAQELFQSVLKAYEKINGMEHKLTVGVTHDLGRLYRLQGNLPDATRLLERAVDANEKIYGPDHAQTLVALYNLALVFQDRGSLRLAEKYFRNALTGLECEYGCSHHLPRQVQESLDSIESVRKLKEVDLSQAP